MKTALITGGYSNLGSAIVKKFEKEGWRVIVTTTKAKGEREEIIVDLSKADTVKAAFSSIASLDCLVCNAGIFTEGEAWHLSEEDYDKVFDLNVKGLYFTIQALLPALKKADGSVVCVSSMNALHPGFGRTAHYDASKGAVSVLVRSLAAETGLRINALAPGLIDAPRLRGSKLEEEWKSHCVKKAMLSPDELASSVFFLATSSGLYGVTLTQDNGYTLL